VWLLVAAGVLLGIAFGLVDEVEFVGFAALACVPLATLGFVVYYGRQPFASPLRPYFRDQLVLLIVTLAANLFTWGLLEGFYLDEWFEYLASVILIVWGICALVGAVALWWIKRSEDRTGRTRRAVVVVIGVILGGLFALTWDFEGAAVIGLVVAGLVMVVLLVHYARNRLELRPAQYQKDILAMGLADLLSSLLFWGLLYGFEDWSDWSAWAAPGPFLTWIVPALVGAAVLWFVKRSAGSQDA
jgi:hypothetical protein